MINITYSDGCKNCMRSDGISKMVTLLDKNKTDFVDQTEYEIIKYLKGKNPKLICPFCGSNALDLSDIKIGELIYQPEELYKKYKPPFGYVFMIKISKVKGEIQEAELGGNKNINPYFIIEAFKNLRSTIDTEVVSGKIFDWGQMFVCISGDVYSTKIERFQHSGIGKQELYRAIDELEEMNPEIFKNK